MRQRSLWAPLNASPQAVRVAALIKDSTAVPAEIGDRRYVFQIRSPRMKKSAAQRMLRAAAARLTMCSCRPPP